MKLKYTKPGTFVFIICAAIGIIVIVAGAMQQDYSIGEKAFCFLTGVVLIFISLIPFALRKRYWASIQSVQIVDVASKTNLGSAVARGMVGEALGGVAGAMMGAASAKQDRSTTFLITFKNGKRKTREIPNDHLDYNRYMRFVGKVETN